MSADYSLILKKIQGFIQKFYVNEVIKGILIFLAVALLYLLTILLLENFLWFSIKTRTLLFWTFIGISGYLFIRFIGISLARLVKLGKQISLLDASKIIGNHFPEIDDQLINLLQLKDNAVPSDLLAASIDQKSRELSPIPFKSAINFKNSLSYAKYALIPVVLFLMFSLFKGFDWYKTSLNRVVNYNVAYEPPAPFYFKVENSSLETLQNSDFLLQVRVEGKSIPSQIKINYSGSSYFLKKTDYNKYSYTFNGLSSNMKFNLTAGDITSREYILEVKEAPSILDFNLQITPPRHVGKKKQVIKNSGTALVPEGSLLGWNVNSKNAEAVSFIYNDSAYSFSKNVNLFTFSKRSRDNFTYQISSSNAYISNYDKLNFNIEVIKDKDPLIKVLSKKDSIDASKQFYLGRISDDYGISKLQLVYYQSNSPKDKQFKTLSISKESIGEFTFQFPNDLNLLEAKNYAFYFEVFDNDSFNGAKASRSETFNYTVSSKIEKQQNESKSDQKQLDDFQNTIDKFQESELDLESFSKLQKQTLSVSFKEKEKLSTVLEKQLSEQKKLEKLAKNLKKTIDKISKPEEENPTKEELERTEKQLEKNKKLIEEIKKAIEKLSPKELKEKVDELQKENKKVTKNLSQILELTKRHYVIEKHERIVQMLELLSDKEIKASKEIPNLEDQKQMNKEFKIIRDELDDLRSHNAKLRKPMVLDDDAVYEGKIETKQKEAVTNIEKSESEKAQRKQNVAGVMMKNLADKMSKTASGGGAGDLKDDEELLRQVLDNLVLFSIDQEDNMERFNSINTNSPNYSKYIRKQNQLKEHFNHIDDSLFAISSRNPKIGTKINDLISDIEYNMDSSLESITDNQTYLGVTKLRFAVSNSNDLALMLSASLKQLNQLTKAGKGKKKKEEFQLPDIIKKQQSLNKAFKQALEAGQKKPGDSNKQQSGGAKKPGDSGKEGQKGDNGKSGSEGEKGQSGQGGKEGQEGKSGESGKSGKGGKEGSSGFGLGQGKSGEGEGQSRNGEKPGGKQGDKSSDGKGKGSGKGKSSSANQGDSKGDNKGGNKGATKEGDNKKDLDNKGEGSKSSGSGKGKSKSDKKGKSGGEGEGNADSENDYEQLFEIFKQQQDLRNQLADKISEAGLKRGEATRVLDQMKQVENELIEKGFNTATLNRMLNLKHQLFKLDKAQFQQGKDKKRKSKINSKSYISNDVITPEQIKKYFNSTEILNREVLPLKPNYKLKVNEYFSK